MTVFIDTNVVVDYLSKREPFYDNAAFIFEMVKQNLIKAVVSSLTLVNCAYIMRQYYEKQIVLEKLSRFMEMLEVSEINVETIKNAINTHPFDFEDAVQYFSSINYIPDLIITRDNKGFRDFQTSVMTPSDFIDKCK